MTGLRRFFLRSVSFLRAGRAEDDLAREINAHLALLEEQYVAAGMSAEEARWAARRAFGGVEQTKEHQRDARSFRWLDDSWLDFKLGARMLVKYPGLSLVGGVAMAVAIAFGTASFAFFYSYLYPTLAIDEGDRVVSLENWDLAANNEERQALHDFVTWREELKSFQEVGAFRTIGRNLIVPGGSVEAVAVAEMTASGFRIARVPPLLGRPLVEDDHRQGAMPVLVIGFDVWKGRFASDPAAVGRQVRLGQTVHTIVGVMPEGFAFPVNHSYWVPLGIDPAGFDRGEGPAIFIFGRLASGVTVDDAQAELTTVGARASAAFPATHAQLRARVLPYTYPMADIQDVSLWQVGLMQLMISMLLVIVAINVAILIYARTATRQGEIAVRTALGARRGRIVAQLFIEALVLASVSAAAGILLATVALDQGHQIMQLEGSRLPFWMNYGLPPITLLYVVGITVLAAVVAGVVPALQATGRGVQSTLRQLSGSTGMQLGKTWTVLIVAQVAFAVAALPIAAAVGWNEVRAGSATPQFAAEAFLVAGLRMDGEPPDGSDPATSLTVRMTRFERFQRDLVARLEAERWLVDLTFATSIPGHEPRARVEVEGLPAAGGAVGHVVRVNHVDLDFFATFGAQVLTGRHFQPEDRDAVRRTDDRSGEVLPLAERLSEQTGVIVNRTFVERVLGGAGALGRRVRYIAPEGAHADDFAAERWYEIVGVVTDLHANVLDHDMDSPELYHAMSPAQQTVVSLAMRVQGDSPSGFVGRIREITSSLDPAMRMGVFPLSDVYEQQQTAVRLVSLVVTLIVVSVLLLSAAGIYALMSFTVAQRRKEIGIRAALGAEPHRLLRSIFARAAVQLAIGVGIGLAAVALLDTAEGGTLLAGKSAVLLPVVSGLMAAAGLLATVGPARRGLRLEPTQALRE